MLPYGRQLIDEEDIQAVVDVLRSDWLTTGPKVDEFEKNLAEKVGSKYAVVFSSGTAALHAAYFVAGLNQGDEIITTPITFAATSNAALYLGAKPVFADIRQDTINIDPAKIEELIGPRTKVIAPVDFAGHPADMDEIMTIARKYNLVVVEDGAHSLGAQYKGRNIGSIAHMTTFSFHPVKHITTGEGGAVVTDSQNYYEKLLLFRSHGIEKDKLRLSDYRGLWSQEMQYLGYNYRLSDIQCALGISQLRKLDYFLSKRRELVEYYNNELHDLKDIILPVQQSHIIPAWHLYVIRVKKAKRSIIFDKLREKGIGTQVHYIPVYWHPYYRNLGYKKGLCPRAEEYYECALTLPLYVTMNRDDVITVSNVIKKYAN